MSRSQEEERCKGVLVQRTAKAVKALYISYSRPGLPLLVDHLPSPNRNTHRTLLFFILRTFVIPENDVNSIRTSARGSWDGGGPRKRWGAKPLTNNLASSSCSCGIGRER